MFLPKIMGYLGIASSIIAALLGLSQFLPAKVAAAIMVASTIVAALSKALTDTDGDGLPG
jgi:hypothetical protein